MTNIRLTIAVEQVELLAGNLKITPLEVVKGFNMGTTSQKEIYEAVKKKHPPKEDDSAQTT